MGFTSYKIERGKAPLVAASCVDANRDCAERAAQGDCGRVPAEMHAQCSASCNACPPPANAGAGKCSRQRP